MESRVARGSKFSIQSRVSKFESLDHLDPTRLDPRILLNFLTRPVGRVKDRATLPWTQLGHYVIMSLLTGKNLPSDAELMCLQAAAC